MEIHEMLALFLVVPELDLGESKCRPLAARIDEVQRHYKLPALAPGKLAIAMLVWTAGRTYIGVAQDVAKRKARQQRPAVAPAPVMPQADVDVPPPLVMQQAEWFQAPSDPPGTGIN